jgi:hypothetical protein
MNIFNKLQVSTRKGEAILLTSQQQRWELDHGN